MKKYLDKLKKKIYINKNLFVFLLVLALVGVGAGALFSLILNSDDKILVNEYLNNFIVDVSNNKINYGSSFFNTFIFTLGFALFIWIFGISIIGIVFILPFLFFKAFVLGFSIGSIIINYKFKGIVLSMIYIVPHNVINILIYILISAYAIIVSYNIFNSMKKKSNFDFKIYMGKYVFALIFSLIVLFISCLYEVFVLPKLISIIINLFK